MHGEIVGKIDMLDAALRQQTSSRERRCAAPATLVRLASTSACTGFAKHAS